MIKRAYVHCELVGCNEGSPRLDQTLRPGQTSYAPCARGIVLMSSCWHAIRTPSSGVTLPATSTPRKTMRTPSPGRQHSSRVNSKVERWSRDHKLSTRILHDGLRAEPQRPRMIGKEARSVKAHSPGAKHKLMSLEATRFCARHGRNQIMFGNDPTIDHCDGGFVRLITYQKKTLDLLREGP